MSDASVTIKLSLPQQYIKDFLRQWEELEEELTGNCAIESCVIELPEGTSTIEVA